MNDEGPMVGDLPNLHVTAQGDVDVEMLNPFVTLARDSEETVLDQNGAAIVVFDQPDDYRSDPDGRAGSRIACGVIQAPK
jgi:Cu-Zn family superoxide dismutase